MHPSSVSTPARRRNGGGGTNTNSYNVPTHAATPPSPAAVAAAATTHAYPSNRVVYRNQNYTPSNNYGNGGYGYYIQDNGNEGAYDNANSSAAMSDTNYSYPASYTFPYEMYGVANAMQQWMQSHQSRLYGDVQAYVDEKLPYNNNTMTANLVQKHVDDYLHTTGHGKIMQSVDSLIETKIQSILNRNQENHVVCTSSSYPVSQTATQVLVDDEDEEEEEEEETSLSADENPIPYSSHIGDSESFMSLSSTTSTTVYSREDSEVEYGDDDEEQEHKDHMGSSSVVWKQQDKMMHFIRNCIEEEVQLQLGETKSAVLCSAQNLATMFHQHTKRFTLLSDTIQTKNDKLHMDFDKLSNSVYAKIQNLQSKTNAYQNSSTQRLTHLTNLATNLSKDTSHVKSEMVDFENTNFQMSKALQECTQKCEKLEQELVYVKREHTKKCHKLEQELAALQKRQEKEKEREKIKETKAVVTSAAPSSASSSCSSSQNNDISSVKERMAVMTTAFHNLRGVTTHLQSMIEKLVADRNLEIENFNPMADKKEDTKEEEKNKVDDDSAASMSKVIVNTATINTATVDTATVSADVTLVKKQQQQQQQPNRTKKQLQKWGSKNNHDFAVTEGLDDTNMDIMLLWPAMKSLQAKVDGLARLQAKVDGMEQKLNDQDKKIIQQCEKQKSDNNHIYRRMVDIDKRVGVFTVSAPKYLKRYQVAELLGQKLTDDAKKKQNTKFLLTELLGQKLTDDAKKKQNTKFGKASKTNHANTDSVGHDDNDEKNEADKNDRNQNNSNISSIRDGKEDIQLINQVRRAVDEMAEELPEGNTLKSSEKERQDMVEKLTEILKSGDFGTTLQDESIWKEIAMENPDSRTLTHHVVHLSSLFLHLQPVLQEFHRKIVNLEGIVDIHYEFKRYEKELGEPLPFINGGKLFHSRRVFPTIDKIENYMAFVDEKMKYLQDAFKLHYKEHLLSSTLANNNNQTANKKNSNEDEDVDDGTDIDDNNADDNGKQNGADDDDDKEDYEEKEDCEEKEEGDEKWIKHIRNVFDANRKKQFLETQILRMVKDEKLDMNEKYTPFDYGATETTVLSTFPPHLLSLCSRTEKEQSDALLYINPYIKGAANCGMSYGYSPDFFGYTEKEPTEEQIENVQLDEDDQDFDKDNVDLSTFGSSNFLYQNNKIISSTIGDDDKNDMELKKSLMMSNNTYNIDAVTGHICVQTDRFDHDHGDDGNDDDDSQQQSSSGNFISLPIEDFSQFIRDKAREL